MVCAQRVCQAQLRCNVSYSQLYCRKMHYISRLNIKFWQSRWSRNVGQGHTSYCVVVKDDYNARFHTPAITAITVAEKCTLTSSLEIKFISPLLQRNELYFLTRRKFSRLDAKYWQSQWSVKWRSRAPGQGACLKRCDKDNYYARFHLHSYHCCREMNFISRLDVKWTLFLDSTQNFDKVSGAWNGRSSVPGQGACLKSVSRVITMQVSSSQLTLLQRYKPYF